MRSARHWQPGLALLALGFSACGGATRDEGRHAINQPSSFEARDLLERSIAHHDPNGVWSRARIDAQLRLERPEQPETNFQYSWDPRTEILRCATTRGEHRIEWLLEPSRVEQGQQLFVGSVDGRSDFPAIQRDEFNVTRERAELWRDYYGFLLGIPMTLATTGRRGARLVDDIQSEIFNGRSVLVLTIEYSEPVGHDTWKFFLDPESYALVGCRFFKEDLAAGETIVFEGQVESEGVRIPALRHWYVTATEEYLGSDRVQTLALEI